MAGAGRRTFQPGEVLTASNVNSYLMDQSVMRFASSAARGSAVGTAVIAEGMVSYLDDVNALEFYDGASWNRFAATGTALATVQDNLGVGLVRIIPPTVNFSGGTATENSFGQVSFSSVTSISFNNVFSSAHKNYKINLNVDSAALAGHTFRLRSSGTDSASNYTWILDVNSTSTSNRFSAGPTGQVEWVYGSSFLGTMTLAEPAAAKRTYGFYESSYQSGTFEIRTGGFVHTTTSSYDGYTLIFNGGSGSGTMEIFGYNP